MRAKRLPFILLGILSLAGCTLQPAGSLANGKAILEVHPQIQGGGLSVQSVVNPVVPADINHLLVKVFTVNNGVETPVLSTGGTQLTKDIASGSLSAPIVFNNLYVNTYYRVRAYAYSDAATASLISKTDSGSYTDIVMVNDDRPNVANLKVQLIDTSFDGQATEPTITFTSGTMATASYEAIN